MSYEDRDGYGVTRPKVIQTPEGTWNFYPKKSAIRRRQMEEGPPSGEMDQGGGGGNSGGGGDDFFNMYDPLGGQGGYQQPAPIDNGQEDAGNNGGIMGDVDIAGFGESYNVWGSGGGGGGGKRKRRR